MTGNHWTDDDMLERLYGDGDRAHLDDCEPCRERWRLLAEKRKLLLESDDPVSADLLRAQRSAVHAAIAGGERRRAGLGAVIASAAATAALAGILLYVPGTRDVAAPQPQQQAAVSDKQLFAEISSELEDPAPRALEPIRALFSEQEQVQ